MFHRMKMATVLFSTNNTQGYGSLIAFMFLLFFFKQLAYLEQKGRGCLRMASSMKSNAETVFDLTENLRTGRFMLACKTLQ